MVAVASSDDTGRGGAAHVRWKRSHFSDFSGDSPPSCAFDLPHQNATRNAGMMFNASPSLSIFMKAISNPNHVSQDQVA
jgi:hypothetical protein